MRMRSTHFVLFFLLFCQKGITQDSRPARLKVFIDCHNGCDMNYIRTEINIVDFLLDRVAADVHVLITDQNTGSGGDRYQLIFYGQNQFALMRDTIYFDNDANNTDFEERELLVKYLKLGLTPYITKTKMAKAISIQMKTDEAAKENKKDSLAGKQKDPWNYWVYRTEFFGNISTEEAIKDFNYNGNLSANRVTENDKLGFELSAGKNKTTFEYEDSAGASQKSISRNDRFEFSHHLVKGIDHHWSWGYETILSRNTRSNNKMNAILRTGVEYNIFPYKMSNTKYFTIAYIVDIRRNTYFDSTLYDKTNETLTGHGIETNLTLNQKWGTAEFGTEYHSYFHDWKFFKLQANLILDIRITGGFSIFFYTAAELIRDQLYLSKKGASFEDVLTRRRELASGYRFETHFGLTYRFGSKLNNFVNPRFGN
jgi:hypothetical protein